MKNMNSPAFSKITKLSRSFSLLFRKGSICASMQSWAYRRPRLYNEDNEIGWSGSRRTSEQARTPIRPAYLSLSTNRICVLRSNVRSAVHVCMLFSTLLLASDGETQLKKATALLSANLILTQFEADFSETPPNAAFMYEQMNSIPDDYVKPDEARIKLQEVYQDRVRADYRQKVNVLLARIAEKNGLDDAFEEPFRKKSGTIPDATLRAVRERHFAASFEAQRKKACDDQLAQVTRDMFPTEEEVDADSEDTLIKKLTKRLADAQKFQVFEENRVYLRDLVIKPAVQDAYRQRTMQNQFLEGVRSSEAVTPEEFATFLEKALLEALPEFKSEKFPMVYTIFPSVKNGITPLSEKKAKTRYVEFLQATSTSLSEEETKTLILADLKGHNERGASRDKIRDLFMKQSLEQAPKRYVDHFAENRRNSVEFYLKKYPIPENEMRAFFETIFAQKQQKAWEAARNSIISEQLSATYPALQAHSWTPKDAIVETYTGIEATEEGRTLRKEILKGVANSSKGHESALQETREQAGALHDQELARGSQALRRQKGLVLACSNDIVAEASTRMATTKPEKLAAELFALFRPRIQAQWPEVREKEIYAPLNPKPGNATSAYLSIFPSVDALLRQLIRDAIQKLAEPKPIPPKEPPPPETPPPPEEKNEPIKLSCVFTIDLKDNQIIIQNNGDISIDQATLPVLYDDYRNQESKTLTHLADQFAEQLEKKAQGQNIELTLDITVKNGMIYYQLVSRLRDRLDYRLKKLSNNEKLSIKLTDKME